MRGPVGRPTSGQIGEQTMFLRWFLTALLIALWVRLIFLNLRGMPIAIFSLICLALLWTVWFWP